MIIDIIQFIFNMLIMVGVLYFLRLIGQIANHKYLNSKLKYGVPVGFLWFLATMQVFSFPFILIQTTFTVYLLFFGLFICTWLYYILKNRQFVEFKVNLKNRQVELLLILFVFIIVAARSMIYSDSWLYSTMISSTIENNLIYSNNGMLADTKLTIWAHRFESYYLFQSVIAFIYAGNYLFALVTEYKVFDAAIIIFSFLELGYQFKIRNTRLPFFAVSLLMMMVVSDLALKGSFMQTTEPPIQLFQISTGTLMFHMLIIPFLIIYYKWIDKINLKTSMFFITVITIGFTAFSNTYYYTLPLYFATILIIQHLVLKRKNVGVFLGFCLTWIFIINQGIGILFENIFISIFSILISLILGFLLTKGYKLLSIKQTRIITYAGVTGYTLLLLYIFNLQGYMKLDSGVNKLAIRINNILVYFKNAEYWSFLFVGIMFVIFCYLVYKLFTTKGQYQKFGSYILVYSLLFLNMSALLLYAKIGIEPITSRIYAMSFIGYLVTIYLFDCGINKKLILLITSVYFFACLIQVETKSIENLIEGNKRYIDNASSLEELADIDFADNSFIVYDNLNATVGSEIFYTGVNKLVVLRPDLSWQPGIDTCEEFYNDPELSAKYDTCYTVYVKNKTQNIDYDFETSNYYIVEDKKTNQTAKQL